MPTSTTNRRHSNRSDRSRRWLRPAVLVPAGAVAAVLLTLGLVLFEPWTLVMDGHVDEAAPGSVAVDAPIDADSPAPSTGGAVRSADDAPTEAAQKSPAPAKESQAARTPAKKPKATPPGPVTLLEGRFISHEHETSGRVKVLKLADGSRVLRIVNLDTSNGPDLRVWLADAPVRKGRAGWFAFDNGTHVDLGKLKGNVGNQNYAVPAGVDLQALRSVSIWCARFHVSFGAVALT